MSTPAKPSAATPRSFESFEVGETHDSPVRTLLAEDVAAFADLTGDRNPIHLDPEFARTTVFRKPIAHGLFLASILAGMAFDRGLLGRNILAIERSEEQYLQPVRLGEQIRGTVRITAKDPDASKRCGRVTWELTLLRLSEGKETVAVQALWKTLVFKEAFLR